MRSAAARCGVFVGLVLGLLAAHVTSPPAAWAYEALAVETKTETFPMITSPDHGVYSASHNPASWGTTADVGRWQSNLPRTGWATEHTAIRWFWGDVRSMTVGCHMSGERDAYSSTGSGGNGCQAYVWTYDRNQTDDKHSMFGHSGGQQIGRLQFACRHNETTAYVDSTSHLNISGAVAVGEGGCHLEGTWQQPDPAPGFGWFGVQCYLGGISGLDSRAYCYFDDIEGYGETWALPHTKYKRIADGGNVHDASSYPTGTTWKTGVGTYETCEVDSSGCTDHGAPSLPASSKCQAAGALSIPELIQLVQEAGFPSGEVETAVAVILAESGGLVAAVGGPNSNGTYDYGLFQINEIHSQYSRERLVSEARYNVAAGYNIWSAGSSWSPWSAYNNGAYLPYVDDVEAAMAGAPHSGTIDCAGSADTAGSGSSDGDDGTGCGLTLNLFRSIKCAFEWAFVPRGDKLQDRTGEAKDELGSSVVGQAGSTISGTFGELQRLGSASATYPCGPRLLPPPSAWVGNDSGSDALRVGCSDSMGWEQLVEGFAPARKVMIAVAWVMVAIRIVRTAPWANGKDAGEPEVG